MLINGVKEYDREGKQVRTCLVIARTIKDGQRYVSKNGKDIGKTTVVPYNRQDGTALFLDVVAFGDGAYPVIEAEKGDKIMAAGRIEEREYNGKTYLSLVADMFENLSQKQFVAKPGTMDVQEFQPCADGDIADDDVPF